MDGKHLSSSHVKFAHKIDKIIKSPANKKDISLLLLSQELEHLASHADILDLTDVLISKPILFRVYGSM